MEKWFGTRYIVVLCLVMSGIFLLLPVPGGNALASTLIVTTADDELNSDGDCSLREALEAANTDTAVDACGSGSGDDTITFSLPAGSTITLNGAQLSISTNVTIDGPGEASDLAVSGNNASRVFFISGASTQVSISGVTIRDGYADEGGGLYIDAALLTLTNCTIAQNTALVDSCGHGGGGLRNANNGTVQISTCTIADNEAAQGGGLHNSGTLTITGSTVQGNTAWKYGGGVYHYANTTILERSTITDNTGLSVGGGLLLYKVGAMTVTNSTISGNTSPGDGAGAYVYEAALHLEQSTICENTTETNGGGIRNYAGTVTLQNTLLAGNTDTSSGNTPDIFGTLTSAGYNLIGNRGTQSVTPATGDQVGDSSTPIDPQLGPLQDNGGPTDTHALLPGSPAIDAGDTATCLATDQRGESRPVDGDSSGTAECDIGAVEYMLAATPTPTPTPLPEPITITKDGNGSGSVLVNSTVICDPSCSSTQMAYVEGETYTFEAQPESDATFDGWRLNGAFVEGIVNVLPGDVVTAIFTLIPAPTADFSAAPVRGYAPLTVVFSNSSTGDITDSAWDFGDGNTSAEPEPVHLYDTAGTYTVSLTATGPGGSDTLTQTDLVEVLFDNQPPVVTIDSPADGAVVAAGDVVVTGTITDDSTLAEVLVNEVAATVSGDAAGGYTFTATVTLESGNQMLQVSAEDGDGAFGFGERLVQVDGDGPEITITAPEAGLAVDSLTPSIEIAFSDFLSTVDAASVQVTLAEDGGASTDITADLTVTTTGADGTLSTALTADSAYTLTVSVSDSLGNLSEQSSRFYVPIDPSSLVAPEEPEDAGWITGTVYDSSTCNEHLSTCTGLAGARVTVAYAGEGGETVSGTILSGPDGWFAFPVGETNIYWLRVEKDDYSYGQREVEVVRERVTTVSDMYLTPLDTNVSYCDSSGCSHDSADGLMQVEVPAGAIPSGQTVEVRATYFEHVEFLPSGELPPGTAETYAFALGNDLTQARVDFLTPVTVKLQNTRGFDPGEQIPIGFWNDERQVWEAEGVATVDDDGTWVVGSLSHFSSWDFNYTARPVLAFDSDQSSPDDLTAGTELPPCSTCPCPDSEKDYGEDDLCFIDYTSGTFTDDYTLPPVSVLGRAVAPRLAYSSRRAVPTSVIDIQATTAADDTALGYVEYELFLEGQKTAPLVMSASEGEYRYRYVWDGRNARGNTVPPGMYAYQVRLSVPSIARYYQAYQYQFGARVWGSPIGDPVILNQDYWLTGTVAIDSQTDSPFGAGWVLVDQQRLYADEAGRILIADGRTSSEFYHANKNLLRSARRDLSERLVWTNYGDGTLQSLETSSGLSDTIDVGSGPLGLALSSDGTTAYVALEGGGDGESLAVVNLKMAQAFGTVTTDLQPASVVLSPDGKSAYIVHWGSKTLQVVNTATRQTVDTILVEAGGDGWHDLAVSPDGRYAYLVGRYYSDAVAVVDLAARELVTTIPSGEQPSDIVVSPDGTTAYVTNETGSSVSMLDLVSLTKVDEIAVGSAPLGIALSPSGDTAYVTNSGSSNVSVVDLETFSVEDTITVGSQPQGIVVTADGSTAYVANRGDNTNSVVDLEAKTELETIAAGSKPTALALTVNAAPGVSSLTENDDSRLTYDGSTYTRVYPNGTHVHFNEDGSHNSTVDRLGNTTSYTYNTDSTTASMSITPAGSSDPVWTWTFSYTDGALESITDPAGRITTFSIDGHNHLTAIASPLEGGQGGVRRFAYDSRGLMTQESDEAGNMSTHVYDDYGRVTSTRSPLRATNSAGSTSATSETMQFTTVDTGYPLLNEITFSDPDHLAATPPDSDELIAKVEYARGSVEGTMDKWGRWLTKTDAEGRTTTFERDSAGHLTQQTDPDGSCTVYQYDLLGNILAKARMEADQCALDPADRDSSQMQITAYTYEDRFSRVKTVADPDGYVTTYVYDYEESAGDSGNLIRIEYPEVEDENGDPVIPTVSYSYNAAGQVTSVADEAGTVTRYVYTSGSEDEAFGGANALFQDGVTPVPGFLTQLIEDEGGANQTTTYSDFDALGNPGTVASPGCCGGGEVTYYTYDDLGRVLTKTDALGIVTTYAYDANGNVNQMIADYTEDGTAGRNIVTIYTYDAEGNLLNARTEADSLLRETSYSYDENGKLATMTDPNGHTTTYSYDDADQLVSVTDALNNTTSYSYTENGKLETVTLPNGTEVTHVYNEFGQEVQESMDEGGLNLTTSYTYDLNGNRLTKTDSEGVVTRYTYDALNRLVSETQDEGGLNLTTTYRYDLNGNVASTTDPRGVVNRSVYDALGRLVSSRSDADGLNLETTFEYDEAGNLESLTDPRGTVTTYEYNVMNRRIAIHEDATGLDLVTHYTYDRLGNQNSITDANGMISVTDYNAFGKPVRSVQDVGGIEAETLYVYDDNLNLIAITDDNGNITQYTYDERNQRSQVQYADGTTVGYTYTPLGSVDTRTNQANELVNFDYDAVERLTGKSYPDGSSQSFTYNAASRLSTAQQTMSGHTTEASFDYDALGSVQEHVQTVDSQSWTTAYSYDYIGGTATTTYPSGTQVVKSLDTLSRLSQVQQDGTLVAGYSYDMTAGTITQTHGDGLSTLVETDPVWRVTGLSSAVADYRYGYDNVGNRTYMQRAHTSGTPADVYQYDNLYQLTQVWYGADATEPSAITAYERLQAYTLDPVGNRLEVENDGVSENYLPNDGQKLLNPMHRYEQVDGQVLGYDLKGNLLEDGENTYTYDVQNQQIGMSGPGGTAEYVYDALGRRVAKIVDGVTTYYVYNAFYQVLEERDSSNQLLARYIYGAGIDEVLTMERSGTSYTYHRDALGSITEVTDASGSLVECYEYDVYGTPMIFDSTDTPLTASAIENPFLFTGRRYDPESGNYYYRARLYSPTMGRFLQMDPLGYVDGLNLYAYVGNNPVNWVDPLGLLLGIDDIFTGPFDEILLITAILGYLASPPGQELQENIIDSTLEWPLIYRNPYPEDAFRPLPTTAPPGSPAIPGPYPEIRPRSPFFPPIALMCDPDALPQDNTEPIPFDSPDTPDDDGDDNKPRRPPKKICNKAIKILEQFARLAKKYNIKLSPKRLAKLNKLRDAGSITVWDLPQTLRKEFPDELSEYTLEKIRHICGKGK